MAFANGLLLGIGALLIAAPVFLHLLMRPRPKRVVFPAIRFIQLVQTTNQRQMRLRHLILLFLRCLGIMLLVLAFAQPSTPSNEFGPWYTLGAIAVSALVVGWLLVLSIFWKRPHNRILIGTLAVVFVLHLFAGLFYINQIMKQDGRHLLGDQQAPVAAVFLLDTSPRMEYAFENQSRLEKAQELGNWTIDRLPLESKVAVIPTHEKTQFFPKIFKQPRSD